MNKDILRNAIIKVTDLLIDQYFDDLPLDVAAMTVKTEAHYARVLSKAVHDLYNGKITADDMLGTMARLLDEQMRRAWNEGMRANELDPQTDMTPEWEEMLQTIIDGEFAYVEGFIADIEKAREDKSPVEPLIARAELWAARYNDVVNQAKIATAEPKDKFEWIYGDTQHCSTCEQLNGIVATAAEWEQSGIRPQSPPNPVLECGGWRCQCRLEPTDKRRTPNALSTLMTIAEAANV